MIFGIHVYQAKTVCCVQNDCWPFELSPLNELYSGKLVRSITLIPFVIF